MTFISLTRLRLRSVRFLPFFAVHALWSLRQIRRAPGFQDGGLLPDRSWTFWTISAWDSQESMRQYIVSGSHKKAMPYLQRWCDEASVAHWEQESGDLPSWKEADRRMREAGRVSKVLHPSARHAGMRYEAPRTTRAGVIRRA